ncbi:MBL fold metallo-hydrolase [Zhengella mangrovi]|uniref:MBL fold metallo-hydrolase n=1 Tax=Zhengella mangrovi TaxID=1982044 RepID=UPI0010549617|nr:MBL fold metallo-hydrolase [Zhengella mangrovi]
MGSRIVEIDKPAESGQPEVEDSLRIEIAVMRAGDGDCILIQCRDYLGSVNILVDGGRREAVENLRAFLNTLPEKDRKIDLFILTHIDADHIEGALAIARDEQLREIVREVWFNDASRCAAPNAVPLSTRQGDDFANLIAKSGWAWNAKFANKAVVRSEQPVDVALGANTRLRLLGPTIEGLRRLASDWPTQEINDLTTSVRPMGAVVMGDSSVPDVETLASSSHSEDESTTNGSSIAFVLEHGEIRILVAADSHAEDIVTALRVDNRDQNQRFDLAFLPHHGADRNTSPGFAQLIESKRWVISTTGARHKHPAPQSIARILKLRPNRLPITLFFNSAHQEAAVWNDHLLRENYNYNVVLPANRTQPWIEIAIGGEN